MHMYGIPHSALCHLDEAGTLPHGNIALTSTADTPASGPASPARAGSSARRGGYAALPSRLSSVIEGKGLI